MATITTYTTHEMLPVVEKLNTPDPFWLNLFFPFTQTFTDEYINFDVVDTGRRLAPFVMPTVAGVPMRQRGYITKSFKPAYIKMKDSVDPSRAIRRLAGEPFGGELTPEQRRDAIKTEILRDHKEQWLRRLNWMAARAIMDDSITISGDDYPTTVISFGRPANQTLTLTSGALWSDAIDPLDNIDEWSTRVQRASGHAPTELILGLDAWNVFRKKATVIEQMDINFRGTEGALKRGPGNGQEVQRRGNIGPYNVWTYSDIYQDETDTVQNFMDQKSIVLTSPGGLEGVRCFGAIQDAQLGFIPRDFVPKNFFTDDPSAEWLLTQSAPLVVPRRPAAALRAKVLA